MDLRKEAELWSAYRAVRGEDSRNALFDFYWEWLQEATFHHLRRRHCPAQYEEVLSLVSERVLTKTFPSISESSPPPRTCLRRTIRLATNDALRTLCVTGRGQHGRAEKINDARTALSQSLGNRPTDAEVAVHLGISEVEVIAADTEPRQVQWDDTGTKMHNRRNCRPAHNFDHLTHGMKPESKRILSLYYIEGYTLKEVGVEMDMKATLVEARLKKIRQFLKKKHGYTEALAELYR